MSGYEKAPNKFKTALYEDCKAQLLKCKRLAVTVKTEPEAMIELGKACGIISIFTKAYGISDQSIELSAIVDSIRDHTTKTIECDSCLRSVTKWSVKENDGFCPLCNNEISLSGEQ
tara:strand:- start:240 stop:587 length:348 start_codon:yes stop_codon:yes gene_type:complete